jgi:hypothetical protein
MLGYIILFFLGLYIFIVVQTNVELIMDYGLKQTSGFLSFRGKKGEERKLVIYFNLLNSIGLLSLCLAVFILTL